MSFIFSFVTSTYIYDYYAFTQQVLLTISLVPGIGDTEQNKTKALHMWDLNQETP